ncbi:hypothetical protein AJ79_07847 [Helicocarpus griseus UAMH5409]|uniref:Uncharacterized protein n=1 Tax=Helicocarpus griseus UAMH5409 TaxID=1447875 RepID=A0A2B7WYP8_9EURO|nr:hypothetical protein AJ79_07847 [Helicocarpus griseus UAMH5409]
MPGQSYTSLDFSPERFEKLSDKSLVIVEGVQLLRDLGSHIRPYLQFIVDGAEVLEDRDDEARMEDLRAVLRTLLEMFEGHVTNGSLKDSDTPLDEQEKLSSH